MSTQPLVTVITPTYNRADDYLKTTIDSVLAQDYANFDYLVLDDGSTDDTQALLASYDDPRLHWETHTNMGAANTVNKGFTLVQGDYFTVVNSDDPLLPNYLTRAVAFMEAHPHVLAAYPDWQLINPQGDKIRDEQVFDYSYLDMLRWHHNFPGPGTILRRRVLELEPGYDTSYPTVFDYDFYLRLGQHGDLARIPQTLATYRMHSGTLTEKGRGHKKAAEHVRVIEATLARDTLPEHIKPHINEIMSSAYYNAGKICLPFERDHARRYFWKAIRTYPGPRKGYPQNLAVSASLMYQIMLLPEGVARFMRRVVRGQAEAVTRTP